MRITIASVFVGLDVIAGLDRNESATRDRLVLWSRLTRDRERANRRRLHPSHRKEPRAIPARGLRRAATGWERARIAEGAGWGLHEVDPFGIPVQLESDDGVKVITDFDWLECERPTQGVTAAGRT